MNISAVLLSLLLAISCVSGKEKIYTASTPAGPVVRSFLGIPAGDSIDFIRWKLVLNDKRYKLHCNYGIGKPNTNGFISGGINIELNGAVKKQENNYLLENGNKTLRIAELNSELLHLLDINNNLLVGNGGWSYTLNSTAAAGSDQINLVPQKTVFKDSMAFEGRTPCNIPGVVTPGTECYKLKWYIVFYGNGNENVTGIYRVLGTPWRSEGARTGRWKIITGKNDRIIYELNDDEGNGMLRLLKLDENIFVFIDADGKLLAGNEDFSYTLNKRF